MYEETGATVAEIANCYVMASEVFQLADVWQEITELDNKISTSIQTEMLFQMRRTVRRATRWFLRHRNKALNITETIEYYRPTFENLAKNLSTLLVKEEVDQLKRVETDLVRTGVPESIAVRISQLSSLFPVMDIADVAASDNRSIELVADLYFKLGVRLDLHWFLDQITSQPVSNHWQALARASFREELDWQQRSLTQVVLHCDCGVEQPDVETLLDTWIETNIQPLERWNQILTDFRIGQTHEFAKFSVALRELMLLSLNCDPAK
jgi:glutamate dehydrogenase